MTFQDPEAELETYAEVGRWWDGEDEIDLVGLNPAADRILFGECKWTSEPVGFGLVESLRKKASQVRWGPDSRDERFVLVSKSGFEDELREELGEQWTLFDVSDIDSLTDPATH
ncbi:MAG: DUF234 domain-containing protein [Halodesulfurarchaeum sp.]|nr:DUF234 domain-containing protein [Halodesulfurarchaeum sp.]